MFTGKTCVNMYNAIQTVRYGPISRCSSPYSFNGSKSRDVGYYISADSTYYISVPAGGEWFEEGH